jgi:hypothetical protein
MPLIFLLSIPICRSHSERLSEQTILSTVHFFVKRIIEEVKLIELNQRKDHMFINKAWNVIRVMSDNQHIVPKYINGILEEIKPLLMYL